MADLKPHGPKVVAHPETGEIITVSSKNPDFGTIRVDSIAKSFNNGFFGLSKRTAFIRGRVEELQSLGWVEGKLIGGKIIKMESFDPFYENQPAKINPQTGEEVLTNGNPTYLQYEYTDNMSATDYWVDQAEVPVTAVEATESQAV